MEGSLVVHLAGDSVKVEVDALSDRPCGGQPAIHVKQGSTGEQNNAGSQGISMFFINEM